MIKKYWQIVAVVVAVFVIGFGLFIATNKTAPNDTVQTPQGGAVSVTIEGLYAEKQVSIGANETVLKMLKTLDAENPQVRLSVKEYAGLGTLVTGINGEENGIDNKYWQYKVNGVMPQIGADAYILKDGDVVEWFFALSQQ